MHGSVTKIIAFILLLIPIETFAGPSIVVDEKIHRYGVHYADDTLSISHQFIVSNSGDEPLVIRDIKSSCGCTHAEISKKEIGPGENALLDTTLAARDKHGKEQIRISLYTNDPNNQVFEVGLSGYIIPRWSIDNVDRLPAVLVTDTTSVASLEINSFVKDGEERRFILDATSEHPLVQAILMDETKELQLEGYTRATQKVRVVVRGGNRASHSEKVTIHVLTTDPQQPVMQFNFAWIVENDVHISPRNIHVIRSKYYSWAKSATVEKNIEDRILGKIFLKSRSVTPFRIISATADTPFKVDYQNDVYSPDAVIIVSITGESVGKHNGILTIITDRPDEDRFEVNLTGDIHPLVPILSYPENSINAGILFEDQAGILQHRFTLDNLGLRPLMLSNVGTDGATATLSTNVIPPGKSGLLQMNTDIKVHRGLFDRFATLGSNDPTQPTVTFHLKGRILPHWKSEPDSIYFKNLLKGDVVSGHIKVFQFYPVWAKPLQIQEWKNNDGCIQVEQIKQTSAYQSIGYGSAETEVKITLSNNRSGGYWETPVQLLSENGDSSGDLPKVTIGWDVLGDIRFRPTAPIIRQQASEQGTSGSTELKIYSRAGKPFDIKSIECPSGITVNPNEAAGSEKMFEIRSDNPVGKNCRLRFYTDRSDEPCVAVDVVVEKSQE